ncbi:hypothetical protein B0H63DRAFT_560308 [Podospora didyma]|uniref:Zn(2)-C6 fungal-type domain-containing protein n=1 Tax=Podospora didyma TaxID=330526 RepID=A0AAE0NQV0_9PEZI|nr:hypothetical protein B0H63DRAFT_560308 [Podospora didyma]
MPQLSEPDFTIPAPYGQACVNCSRSKSKCMRRTAGGPCHRCCRRGQESECRPNATTHPSGPRRKAAKKLTSRTTQLEAKLDSLVTLLQSKTAAQRSSNALLLSPDNTIESPNTSHQSPPPPDPIAPSTSRTTTSNTDPDEHSEVSPQEADECLAHFRSKLRYFPIVHVAPDATAAQLQVDRPYLWLAILAVSVQSSSRQLALGGKLRRLAADSILIHNERSFDMLLALLTYLGWPQFQQNNQPFLGMYSHLILGLVHDLGLDKPPLRGDEPHAIACLRSYGMAFRCSTWVTARTMEERRATLAAYVVTSGVSSFIRKIDPLRWTPYMEESLQMLEERKETPNDAVLACLVRLKLIGDEATKPPWPPAPPSEHLRLVQTFQMKALQSRIDDIRRSLPAEMLADQVVQLHLLHTELEVSELVLWMQPSKSTTNSDPQRLHMLTTCVHNIRAWFDIFLQLSPAPYFLVGFSIWVQFIHVLVSLYRLSILDEQNWDRNLVRSTVDVIKMMDEVIQRFECIGSGEADFGVVIGSGSGEGGGDHTDRVQPFSFAVRQIRALKAVWEPVVNNSVSGAMNNNNGQGPGGGGLDEGGSSSAAAAAAAAADPNGAADLSSWMETADSMLLDGLSSDFVEGISGWMSEMFLPPDMGVVPAGVRYDLGSAV